MHYASPSSLTTGSSACEQDICSCFLAAVVCPRTTSKAFQFLGLGFGLSEGGPLPSGVGGVSSKAAAPIFVPSIAVPSRPPRSFWIYQIYRSSVPLSLSRPHLANDEAHALNHGYACSESTSASLRPKFEVGRPKPQAERQGIRARCSSRVMGNLRRGSYRHATTSPLGTF